MNVRTLINVAYRGITEGMTREEKASYDDLLDAVHNAWIRKTTRRQKTAEETLEEKRRRMFRLVPDQSRQLAATMAGFGGGPGAQQRGR